MENFRASSPRAPGIPGSSDWHAQPKIRGQALGIVYRTIATHLTRKADYTKTTAHTGADTLIRHFGGALNLNNGLRHGDRGYRNGRYSKDQGVLHVPTTGSVSG